MTTPYRLQHDLRMRYTDLLQRQQTVGLTAAEAVEFALLRAQVTAFEAPIYASLPRPLAAGRGIELSPLVAKEP